MKWETLQREIAYKNKWMEVTEDRVRTSFGKEFVFSVVHKAPFALIVPWDGTRFTLVGQYRYSVDYFSWEFPMGHCEHDSALETARVELQEEAGLAAASFEEVGRIHLASGSMDQVGYLFLALGLSPVPTDRGEAEEGMEVQSVTLEELDEMIRNDVVVDGPTLAAISLLRAKKITPFDKA